MKLTSTLLAISLQLFAVRVIKSGYFSASQVTQPFRETTFLELTVSADVTQSDYFIVSWSIPRKMMKRCIIIR